MNIFKGYTIQIALIASHVRGFIGFYQKEDILHHENDIIEFNVISTVGIVVFIYAN